MNSSSACDYGSNSAQAESLNAIALFVLGKMLYASGHGPVFALATPTNPKGGWSFDSNVMARVGKTDTGSMTRLEIGYGATEDLKVTFSAPAVFGKDSLSLARVAAFTPMGWDFELLATWRIMRFNTAVGRRIETALVGGPITPGPQDSAGILKGVHSGVGGLFGIVSGVASRSHYLWTGVTYKAYSTHMRTTRKPDIWSYSVSYAYRPPSWRTNSGWDWRVFGELTGEKSGTILKGGIAVPGSEAHRIFVGPTTLGVHRNYAISAGTQVPVYQSKTAVYPTERFRFGVNFAYFF